MSAMLRAAHLARLARASCFTAPRMSTRCFASYPADRRYSKSHEWALVQDDGIATIGITDHAQKELGEIVFADLPDVGSDAEGGARAATVESVKAAADIYSPISGEVVQINAALSDQPGLINTNAHDDGWMFKVKVADPAQVEALLSSEEYSQTVDE